MTLPRDDIEALIRAALPAPHQARAGEIADLITARIVSSTNSPPADHHLALALNALRGQELSTGEVRISFDGAQTGDITIEGVAGRDIIRTTINIALPPPRLTPHMQFQRRRLLQLVRLTCVAEGASMLPGAAPPSAVVTPSPLLAAPRALPDAGRVAEAFTAAGRSLLILGAPGSGKTTLLLELCRELLARAEQDEAEPIPVILSLATWVGDRRPLQHWMIDMLVARPYLLPRNLAETLVSEGNLAPLLDGLDEVDARYREACVAAVNLYLGEHFATIALTAREDDYASLATRPNLRRAVRLRPLDGTQIEQALAGRGVAGAQLRAAATGDDALRDLLRTPLALQLATQAQLGANPLGQVAWTAPNLLATYIRVMLQYRTIVSQRVRVRELRGLRWVARRLRQDHQPVFYLEHLQPSHVRKGFPAAIYRGGFLVLRIVLLVVMPVLAILLPAWLGLLLMGLVAPAASLPQTILPAIALSCALVIVYGAIFVFTTGASRDEPIRAVVRLRWSPSAIREAMDEQLQMLVTGLRHPQVVFAVGFAVMVLLACGLLSRPEATWSILTTLVGLALGMPVAVAANAVLQGIPSIIAGLSRLAEQRGASAGQCARQAKAWSRG